MLHTVMAYRRASVRRPSPPPSAGVVPAWVTVHFERSDGRIQNKRVQRVEPGGFAGEAIQAA